MKKLILFVFAMVALTISSCSNHKATTVEGTVDSLAIDSVEAVVDSAEVVVDSIVADTTFVIAE